MGYTTPKKYTPKPTYKPTTKYTTPKQNYGKPTYNNGYTQYPGPIETYNQYCPWTANRYSNQHNQYYPGDCKKGACNAKYSARCMGNLFNKVYKGFCKADNAKTLVLEITKNLVGLGSATEKHWGTECNYSKAGSSNARSVDRDPIFDFAGEDLSVETHDDGYSYDDYGDRKRRNPTAERAIGGSCDVTAGNFKCGGMKLHEAKDPSSFIATLQRVINAIAPKCNNAWKNSMNQRMTALRNQINC